MQEGFDKIKGGINQGYFACLKQHTQAHEGLYEVELFHCKVSE